ncbi:MAG TPA: hypothetical protein VFH45_03275 [Acidimicrobiales bacterium]|nr:hypothetical protein [Acidimicrobiales bacterium]
MEAPPGLVPLHVVGESPDAVVGEPPDVVVPDDEASPPPLPVDEPSPPPPPVDEPSPPALLEDPSPPVVPPLLDEDPAVPPLEDASVVDVVDVLPPELLPPEVLPPEPSVAPDPLLVVGWPSSAPDEPDDPVVPAVDGGPLRYWAGCDAGTGAGA